MTRRFLAVLLAGGVLLTSWAWAQEPPADKDEPPLRLKKKAQPHEGTPEQPKPPKPDEKKPEVGKEPAAAEPDENDKEVLERIARNMRSLEERLANKELGDGTRQVGEDILKDLDSLIRLSEKPPPQGGGAGEDPQNNPAGPSNDQKNQAGKSGPRGQSSPSAGGGGKRRDKMNQGGSGTQSAGGQQLGGPQPMSGGNPAKQPGGETNASTQKNGASGNDLPGEQHRNADLYKDIWGHLPEALRAEMNAYSSDKEMIPKYDALIRKTSRTIAEQSSRKNP